MKCWTCRDSGKVPSIGGMTKKCSDCDTDSSPKSSPNPVPGDGTGAENFGAHTKKITSVPSKGGARGRKKGSKNKKSLKDVGE